MFHFEITKKTDPRLKKRMEIHYSQPKGFVGRSICYAIYYNNVYHGHIVGGSACKNLPNRYEFLELDKKYLNNIVNNVFYSVFKVDGKYPKRNFTTFVVKEFENQIKKDWFIKYNDRVFGLETLVEPPRTGELYLRAGWTLIGKTKGFTCKRISSKKAKCSTDSWGGQRVWDYENLRPKLVFAKKCFEVPR